MTDPRPLDSPAEPDAPEDREPDAPDDREPDASEEPRPEDGQVLLVRRRRVPALGFWVALVLVIPFLAGMVVAWVVDVRTLTGMLYFGVTAALLIGFPLALVAAVVDAVLERRRRRTAHGPGEPPVG